uniref:Secreted protein n=1 Tax=Plectus sambesii TaxID=2011161 RepID=A0A914VG56_9BILA
MMALCETTAVIVSWRDTCTARREIATEAPLSTFVAPVPLLLLQQCSASNHRLSFSLRFYVYCSRVGGFVGNTVRSGAVHGQRQFQPNSGRTWL